MMLANGAKETTTTTGTGTVTLSAVTGFPRFSQVLGVGQFVDYAIQDGNNWEWGVGKVAASNTLERTLITAKFDSGTYSKNPATRLSLSGSATVFCTLHEATQGEALGGSNDNWSARRVFSGILVKSADYDTSYAVPANQMVMFPWVWPVGIPRYCNGLSLNVKTTGTATKLRVGLFELGATYADRKIVAETADLSATATGQRSHTISPGIYLPLSRYMIALVADGTVTVSGAQSSLMDPYRPVGGAAWTRKTYTSSPVSGWTGLSSFAGSTVSAADGFGNDPIVMIEQG